MFAKVSAEAPRPSGRTARQLRTVSLEMGFSPQAEGSCLVKFGNTHVLCTVTVEEKLPHWMKTADNSGWITAEYGMLPRATHQRTDREAARGKQTGRTQEIQRLIGRAMRAVTDLKKLGPRQLKIDCDVIRADGGTRTAAITGTFVAVKQAIIGLMDKKLLLDNPLLDSVAAVSCGVVGGQTLLDLDYAEDSSAEVDANFVLTGTGRLVEIQCTAEKQSFDTDTLMTFLALAKSGCDDLTSHQNACF